MPTTTATATTTVAAATTTTTTATNYHYHYPTATGAATTTTTPPPPTTELCQYTGSSGLVLDILFAPVGAPTAYCSTGFARKSVLVGVPGGMGRVEPTSQVGGPC